MPQPPPVQSAQPQPAQQIVYVQQPPAQPDLGALSEPAVVVDAGATQDSAAASDTTTGAGSPASATLMRNQGTVVARGTLIKAVLETPIDSTRPGFARAVVARDTLSFDGRQVLIPRGSRLIGEFLADTVPGQSRVLILWTELIRPDGAVVELGSPSADALGGGGVAGKVNSHFFARFGGAILQSVLSIGVASATQSNGNANAVVIATPDSLQGATQGVAQPADVRPSIEVRAGETITIFVARQLDFAAVAAP